MYIRIFVYMYICIYVYLYICICVYLYICIYVYVGADPEGGFGDLSPLNFLEVKIIKWEQKISVEIFSRDPNGDSYII